MRQTTCPACGCVVGLPADAPDFSVEPLPNGGCNVVVFFDEKMWILHHCEPTAEGK